MRDVYLHSAAMMGTVVSIQIVGTEETARDRDARARGAARAMEWFRRVERTMTRFDPESELRRLTGKARTPVKVSPMLFATVQFALALAEETGGAFDPTVGHRMEMAGFDRHFRTWRRENAVEVPDEGVSWRDVELDVGAHTIMLRKPMVLDLGAVAKGLAVDLAARELERFENYAIDAGGDLFFAGVNQEGGRWRVGIRDPRKDEDAVIERLEVSDCAVCTSGDYERVTRRSGGGSVGAAFINSVNAESAGLRHADTRGTATDLGERRDERGNEPGVWHHILDPRTGGSPGAAVSVTVVAPTAMVADALSTAAFVMGPAAGLGLLERHGVQGMVITPSLERFTTRDWAGTPVTDAEQAT